MSPVFGLGYVEHLSYIGTFFAVAFSGYVIPIPEELILILGGFLAARGVSHIFVITIVSIFGAIFGDNVIYYLSRHGSRFTQKYHEKVESTHAGWYMRHMRKNPSIMIFLSRFIVGFRFLNPLVSGLLKVPWQKFFIASALSALIYIPAIISIGFFFHNEINQVIAITERIQHVIIGILTLGSVALVFLFFANLLQPKN